MNVLKPHLQTTVSTLLASGKSHHEIARITHVDRKAIRRLAQRISNDQSKAPGVTTGSTNQKPPPRPPAPSRQVSSACEPHRLFIQAQLRLHRNFTAIYQDLVDQFATWNLNNRVGMVGFRPEAANVAIALEADVLVFNER